MPRAPQRDPAKRNCPERPRAPGIPAPGVGARGDASRASCVPVYVRTDPPDPTSRRPRGPGADSAPHRCRTGPPPVPPPISAEPGVYGFGELLELPQVQDLRSSEHAGHLLLLEVFAHGVWRDALAAADRLPPLSEAQHLKLRQLTVASMAGADESIAYDALMPELGIASTRDLEDFLIGCLYAGVVEGALDQQGRRVLVRDALGRDVRRGDLGALVGRLQRWLDAAEATCSEVRAVSEATLGAAAEASAQAAARQGALRAAVDVRLAAAGPKKAGPGGAGDPDEALGSDGDPPDGMDVDVAAHESYPEPRGDPRLAKRRR